MERDVGPGSVRGVEWKSVYGEISSGEEGG